MVLNTHKKQFFGVGKYILICWLSVNNFTLGEDKLNDNYTILAMSSWGKGKTENPSIHTLYSNDTTCFPSFLSLPPPIWCLSFCCCLSLFFILSSYISHVLFRASDCILAQAKSILGWCPRERFTKMPLWEVAASRCEHSTSATTSAF